MKVADVALPESFAARIGALPVMPGAAKKALALTRSDRVEFSELARVIEVDGALTADLLRFTNSAWFGFRKPVANIPHAIALVGLGQLRSILLASVVKGMARLIPPEAADQCYACWTHAVKTAAAARKVASQNGYPWSDEAFAAGLLHDCGRDIMLILETEAYLELFDASSPEHFPTPEAERARFGFTHADVGSALLRIWKLPHELVNASLYHHDPHACEGPDRTIACVVAVADAIAYSAPAPPQLDETLVQPLGLRSPEALEGLCSEVLEQLPEDVARVLDACAMR